MRFALRSSLLLCTFVYAATVPLTLAADAIHPLAGTAMCVLLVAIGNAASGTASTASFAATNNAAAKFPRRVGTISGVHVTAEAVGKMLGPAIGAPLLGALLTALKPAGAVSSPSLSGALATALEGPTLPAPSAATPAETERAAATAAVIMFNGASATMIIFSALSFSVFLAAMALPQIVDGPHRSSTLLQGQMRSDAETTTSR